MSTTMKDLGIDQLSTNDRLALVHEIWDSIAAEEQPVPISDALKAELARRAAEDDADPDGGIPWEQVKAELRARRAK
jgi:putative addiction module component (TIGR02574 family)